VGRGPGSGTGKTAGKGHKGSMARSGHGGPGGGKPGFEGGQMPLTRRLPKKGFNNAQFRTENQRVRLGDLADLAQGGEITMETLVGAGLVRANKGPAKVLANGDVASAITVRGLKVSDGAAGEDRSGRRPRRGLSRVG
jgi:large subunit ribosomal protein L15